jgi:hypothetical protein
MMVIDGENMGRNISKDTLFLGDILLLLHTLISPISFMVVFMVKHL